MKKYMKKFILFLLRIYLGVEKYKPFRFTNQASDAIYYFDNDGIQKWWCGCLVRSHVSLNWLLDDECVVTDDLESVQVKRTNETPNKKRRKNNKK